MILDIFDVEHGACALITTTNHRHVMIDCGTNTTTGWKPGKYLRSIGISHLDQLIVSNYDEDHVAGIADLCDQVNVAVLSRNLSVNASTLRSLKTEDGMGPGIDRLASEIEKTYTGGAPSGAENDYGDVKFAKHRNAYGIPPYGFDDENNLSLVTFITCLSQKFIFPGDMEKPGWKALLLDAAFRAELADVSVFVASHHGRESGYCEDVLNLCPNIQAVVISDKKLGYQTQETVDRYRNYARGFMYNDARRHVLTTRSDGSMRFIIDSGSSQVFLSL
ncbi:beta-lactamase superfamily II metal-dependent hydrolase [Bradyrhizobium japonicum]|uniref:Beta-lactamase superfamily II metal-dependent hydrolase n=1 Tax=Bradyrhizobium japonicum TaxID=375 RepID=A0ABV2RJ53_BRAJP